MFHDAVERFDKRKKKHLLLLREGSERMNENWKINPPNGESLFNKDQLHVIRSEADHMVFFWFLFTKTLENFVVKKFTKSLQPNTHSGARCSQKTMWIVLNIVSNCVHNFLENMLNQRVIKNSKTSELVLNLANGWLHTCNEQTCNPILSAYNNTI